MGLVSMLLLGILGIGHCIGMCGPLVLALPARGPLTGQVAYHLGRVTTYALVGAVIGGLGAGLREASGGGEALGSVARLQVIISLVSAILLTALGLVRLGLLREPSVLSFVNPMRLPGWSSLQKRAAKRGGTGTFFLLGLLLGMLPCGLSYAAFARALIAAGPQEGVLLLLAFGAGTVPGLLILGTGGAAFARRHRHLTDLLAGMLLIAMALKIGTDAILALV